MNPYTIGRQSLDSYLTNFYARKRAKAAQCSTPAPAAPRPTLPAAQPIDPTLVGRQAYAYQQEKRKLGIEISASTAVAFVLAQRGRKEPDANGQRHIRRKE